MYLFWWIALGVSAGGILYLSRDGRLYLWIPTPHNTYPWRYTCPEYLLLASVGIPTPRHRYLLTSVGTSDPLWIHATPAQKLLILSHFWDQIAWCPPRRNLEPECTCLPTLHPWTEWFQPVENITLLQLLLWAVNIMLINTYWHTSFLSSQISLCNMY